MTLREQLIRDEGKQRRLYYVNGIPHIGVGHNLQAKAVSKRVVEMILDDDLFDAEYELRTRLPWTRQLDDVRRAVLVTMVFNMGMQGLIDNNPLGLAACERGDYAETARQMLDGPWKDQVGARASRLAAQMADGQWC